MFAFMVIHWNFLPIIFFRKCVNMVHYFFCSCTEVYYVWFKPEVTWCISIFHRKSDARKCSLQLRDPAARSSEWKTYSSKPCIFHFLTLYVWGVVLSIGIPSYVNVIGYDTVTASGLNGLLGTLQLTLRIWSVSLLQYFFFIVLIYYLLGGTG